MNRYTQQLFSDPFVVLPVVLDEANEIRKALAIGDGVLPELPRGIAGNSDECVLARALSNGWIARVDGSQTWLDHPLEGKTVDDIITSVDVLDRLDFRVDWRHRPETTCSCDDPRCSKEGFSIVIEHTWAMEKFIGWFDEGAFPDLILESVTA